MKTSVYMTWAKRHAVARYNLARSGVHPCRGEDLPGTSGEMPLDAGGVEGFPPLMEAIAAHHGVAPDEVVLAPGTSGANFLACATLLDRGDEVLVEQPTYEPLLAVIRYLGGVIRRFPRAPEHGFRWEAEEIGRLLTPRTRMIVLTSPHNPSGVVSEAEDLRRLGEMAVEAEAWVLVDEVYRDILFEAAPPSAGQLGSRLVATGSLTKSYGLGALRCGWVLCRPGPAERMRRMNDLLGVVGPLPSEFLGWTAFRNLSRLAARTRSILDPNSVLLGAFLDEHADLLDCVRPDRSLTVFPRLRHADSSDPLHDRLRKRETSIVPGRFFEMPGHFRLGIGGPAADLAEGLSRLSATLRELHPSAS